MGLHFDCQWNCGSTDCYAALRPYTSTITNTSTHNNHRNAKDTVEWFAGRYDLYAEGEK